jgi:hypothetical protein
MCCHGLTACALCMVTRAASCDRVTTKKNAAVLPTDSIKSNHGHSRGALSFAGEADKHGSRRITMTLHQTIMCLRLLNPLGMAVRELIALASRPEGVLIFSPVSHRSTTFGVCGFEVPAEAFFGV